MARQPLVLTTTICLLIILQLSDGGTLQRSVEDFSHALNERGLTGSCKKEGYGCRGVPSCCGDLVCYWEGGFSLRKDGECVRCVQEGQMCQRDSQCCGHMQCDKTSLMTVDGICSRYRRTGKCYRDGQCVNKCLKKWYKFSGQCS